MTPPGHDGAAALGMGATGLQQVRSFLTVRLSSGEAS